MYDEIPDCSHQWSRRYGPGRLCCRRRGGHRLHPSSRAPHCGCLAGVYLLFAIKVVRQWEKVALLRLGRYVGLRGPGLFHIVPVLETLSPFVDQRVRVASVTAESTLTRDTVPVNVDAIASGWCGMRKRRSSKWKISWKLSI